jgi:hypothetical protein
MTEIAFLKDYLDLAAFASAVGRDERTVRRWMDEPEGLPFARLGGRRLVHGPTAEQWLLKRVRSRNRERQCRSPRAQRKR